MQDQASARPSGVVIASGYGLKVHVERGHLVVHDGIADDRQTRQFARVSSGLKRLVVLGQAGYLTLDALAWIRDTGAAFVQLDSDGRLVALSASPGTDQPGLRRAQALAAESDVGVEVARTLLQDKITGQANLLSELHATNGLTTALDGLGQSSTVEELLGLEASAALEYWEAWRDLEVPFGARDRAHAPKHWLTFGQRHSPLTSSARLAANPPNAILNYLYSLLEAEATLACQAVGLDPGLGIFHRDRRSRASLALDVMEACRPAVDAYLLALLHQRTLRKGDFVETRRGVCRVLPRLARELAGTAPAWRRHVAPVAERVACILAEASGHETPPTRLTGTARSQAWEGRRRRPTRGSQGGLSLPATCRGCGGELPDRRRRYCDACRRDQAVEAGKAARPAAAAVLAQLRREGRDPAHGGDAAMRRGSKNAGHQRALREWEAQNRDSDDPGRFQTEVLPLLRSARPRDLALATGLSEHYCSLIRLGKRVPHPRHWETFRAAARH